jgi:hypothetical protein
MTIGKTNDSWKDKNDLYNSHLKYYTILEEIKMCQ